MWQVSPPDAGAGWGTTPAASRHLQSPATDEGGHDGQYLPGEPVDAFISQWVLTAREPAALTLSLEATARLEQERQALDRLWQQRLERAAYESERAARHYRVVEPEHRLVARQLAHNIPALWHAPTTTLAECNEMVRQIIRRVMVAGEGTTERLQVTIAWGGGGTTAGVITCPMSRIEHLRDDPQLCARSRALAQAGYNTAQITACLARQGCRSPKQAKPFSRPSVVELMQRFAVHHPRRRRRRPLRTHEWWLSDLARAVGVSHSTLHRWRQCGWLQARGHAHSKRWVAWAAEAELQRLQQRGAPPTGDESYHMWLDAQPSQSTTLSHFTNV